MPEHTSHPYTWTVVGTQRETDDTTTLFLEPQGEMPHYIPGQYLTVLLPHLEPVEGKSYSISSIPSDSHLTLTITAMGTFSKYLTTRTLGDTLTTSAPYGFFYPEPGENQPLVFIAGGIGITPCMSIIRNELTQNTPRDIRLFYSNKTLAGSVFLNTLTILEKSHLNFTVYHHLTREEIPHNRYTEGRISGSQIHANVRDPARSDFFVCGSIGFTRDLWQELRSVGVRSNQIFTEGFF